MFFRFVRALRCVSLIESKIVLSQQNNLVYKTALFSSSTCKSVASNDLDKCDSTVGTDGKDPLFTPSPVKDLLKELIKTSSMTQRTLSDSLHFKKILPEAKFKKLYNNFSMQLEKLMVIGRKNSDSELPSDVTELLREAAVHKSIPYIISSSACRQICKSLGDLSDPSVAYVLNSPGPGLLASEMIKQGVESLHLFEKNTDFSQYLTTKFENEPNVAVHNQDILTLMWRLRTADTNKLEFLKVLDSEKYSTIKVILVIDSIGQFGIMLGNHLSGFFPSEKKKIEFYFMVPSTVGELLVKLTLNNFGRRGVRGLWELFAISKHIDNIPSVSVFPPFPRKHSFSKANPNVMIFKSGFRVISTSKRRLTETERPYLALFTRHYVPQSKEFVVNALEKWIPGIGLPLVLNGLSVFSRFRDLSHEEYLEVFYLFYDQSNPDSTIWAMIEDQRFVEAKAISADSVTQP